SLLEGVVFAARIGRALEEEAGDQGGGAVDNRQPAAARWATLPEGAPHSRGEAEARPGNRGNRAPGPGGGGANHVRGRLRRGMTGRGGGGGGGGGAGGGARGWGGGVGGRGSGRRSPTWSGSPWSWHPSLPGPDGSRSPT